mmetsp:Transcript_21123/g.62276  ORF Transcript_21123/g.62276 Transcript_21123/m.62276 type:complete len:219 (+) Transcript_21123:161-817(+)
MMASSEYCFALSVADDGMSGSRQRGVYLCTEARGVKRRCSHDRSACPQRGGGYDRAARRYAAAADAGGASIGARRTRPLTPSSRCATRKAMAPPIELPARKSGRPGFSRRASLANASPSSSRASLESRKPRRPSLSPWPGMSGEHTANPPAESTSAASEVDGKRACEPMPWNKTTRPTAAVGGSQCQSAQRTPDGASRALRVGVLDVAPGAAIGRQAL